MFILKEYISNLIYESLNKKIPLDTIQRTTSDSKLINYDYASSIFISNKNLDFQDFKSRMTKNKGIACVEQVNDFVNICLDRVFFLNEFNIGIKKEKKKVMVEFSSPNTNKPLHIGHVRNTLLGNALSNLLSKKYEVVRANLINDRGIHICKSMLAYMKFSKFKSPEEAKTKSDLFVGDCYVLFNNAEKENPKIIEEAEALLLKWEAKDPDTLVLWTKMNDWALKGMKKIYNEFGIDFDVWFFESEIYDKGKDIIFDAYNKGKVELDTELGYTVKFGDKPEDYKVVLRKNGTCIYITQDIYLAKLKIEKYKLDKSIYVVGSEQNDYFDKLIKVLEHIGIPEIADKMEHYSYGMISLPSGKLKSREGNVVDAYTLIDAIRQEALEILKEKQSNKSSEDLKGEAKQIADAAIKYFILKYDAKKDFVFDIKTSLSFDGNSGPYILYSYARICSLLKKMQETKFKPLKSIEKLETKEELNLGRIMLKYPDRLSEAIEKESVHFLVNYITDLANHFNTTYANIKLITKDKEIANRFLFYTKMKSIFNDVFAIMGIKPLERM